MSTLVKRGSGTPTTSGTTWTTTTNAVSGTPPTFDASYAVWTSSTSGAVGYIEVSGYDFSSIPSTATLDSISVTLRHFENNTSRIPTVAFQVYDGATTIGASVSCTVATSARSDTATRNPTLAQLKSGTFKVRATATRAAVTQSATFNVDAIDVTAIYTHAGALFFMSSGESIPGIHRGTNSAKLDGSTSGWNPRSLRSTRGSTATEVHGVTSVTGPTSGLEASDTTNTRPMEWYTPPLAADVTIAGAIAFSLVAESNTGANAAVNAVVDRIDVTGAIVSEIARTSNTTGLAVATPNIIYSMTATPTSTNMLKGERVRVRVFFDDSTTMATGQSLYFFYNGPTPGTDDSYVAFTETLTFLSTEPTGTILYPTTTTSVGSNLGREMWTSRGAGYQAAPYNTITGWTAPVQLNDGAGGLYEWFSKPLTAFTLDGLVRVNLRAWQSDALAQVGVRAEIAVTDSDGTNAVTWAAAGIVDAATPGAAWATNTGTAVDGMLNIDQTKSVRGWLAGQPKSVTDGQRIRLRILWDDTAGLPMATGYTTSFDYGATSGGANGDSWIQLPQTVTEYSLGPSTINGTVTSSFGITADVVGTVVAEVITGTATASFDVVATAIGTPITEGTATASFGITATAIGTPITEGTATASFDVAATATGSVVGPVMGVATSSFGTTATATGSVDYAMTTAGTGASSGSAAIEISSPSTGPPVLSTYTLLAASAGGSRTVQVPTSTVQDDLLIVISASITTGGTPAPPSGWTEILAPTTTGTLVTAIWARIYQTADGSSYANWTVAAGTNQTYICLRIVDWVGSIGSLVVGSGGTRAASGGTTTTTAPAVTVTANTLVIGSFTERTTATESGVSSIDNSFTEYLWAGHQPATGIESVEVVERTFTSSGSTGTVTVTYPNTQASNGLGILIGVPPEVAAPSIITGVGSVSVDFAVTVAGTVVAEVITGVAAATLDFAATATGTVVAEVITGVAAATLDFSVTAAGTVIAEVITGTATTTLDFAATAAGTVVAEVVTGVATATLGFVATAAGTPITEGTATASFGIVATATGTVIAEVVTGVVTSSLSFVAIAIGTPITEGTATASFGITATATGTVIAEVVTGTVASSFDVTALAAGTRVVPGTSTASFGIDVFVAGSGLAEVVTGTATASLSFDTTVIGIRVVPGAATASFETIVTAAGTPITEGTAAASFGITATVVGTRVVLGVVTASFATATTVTGTRVLFGTSTASFGVDVVVVGSGIAEVVTGTVAVSLSFDTIATGTRVVPATATASFGTVVTAIGVPHVDGSMAASFGITATVAGTRVVVGVATASFAVSVTAAGLPYVDGTATASFDVVATATGIRIVPGVVTASFGTAATAAGSRITFGTAVPSFSFVGTAIAGVLGTQPLSASGLGQADGSVSLRLTQSITASGTVDAGLGWGESSFGEVPFGASTAVGYFTGASDLTLVSGAITWDISASGVGVSEGVVTFGADLAVSASGQGVFGGEAPTSRIMPLAAGGSGLSDGSAPVTRLMPLAATGTGISGGAVVTISTLVVTTSGSGLTVGSASISRAHPLSALGTGTTIGSGAIEISVGSINWSVSGQGFSQTDGSVTTRGVLATSPSGSGTSSGAVALISTLVASASGLAATGGSVWFAGSLPLTAIGTGTTGGDCALANWIPFSALGVGQTTGLAITNRSIGFPASGFSQTEGTALLVLRNPIDFSMESQGVGQTVGFVSIQIDRRSQFGQALWIYAEESMITFADRGVTTFAEDELLIVGVT